MTAVVRFRGQMLEQLQMRPDSTKWNRWRKLNDVVAACYDRLQRLPVCHEVLCLPLRERAAVVQIEKQLVETANVQDEPESRHTSNEADMFLVVSQGAPHWRNEFSAVSQSWHIGVSTPGAAMPWEMSITEDQIEEAVGVEAIFAWQVYQLRYIRVKVVLAKRAPIGILIRKMRFGPCIE
jgi:hypothetical protein